MAIEASAATKFQLPLEAGDGEPFQINSQGEGFRKKFATWSPSDVEKAASGLAETADGLPESYAAVYIRVAGSLIKNYLRKFGKT